ncbi:MAG: TPM domain-containing protein [Burkholderiaceae bacterium]|nr:TPM domain-containing protein [Burkholderiaceae bacterium]
MNIKRIVKHLLSGHRHVRRTFPSSTLNKIEAAIKASEAEHSGEIRFAVEGGLDGTPLFKGQSARERAVELFSQLRIWDTQHNTGVLIYLLLGDRAVEIVADRGIHAKVDSQEWNKVCRQMEVAFRQSNFEGGVVAGVQAVTQHLKQHFPSDSHDRNELPDKPVVL